MRKETLQITSCAECVIEYILLVGFSRAVSGQRLLRVMGFEVQPARECPFQNVQSDLQTTIRYVGYPNLFYVPFGFEWLLGGLDTY